MNAHATKIVIEWSDQCRHEWVPNPDGTWDLRVTGPKLPGAGRTSLNLMGEDVRGAQINVRQPPARYAILEAAAFVQGKASAHKLVKELVDDAVDRYAASAPVQKALEARREQAAEDEGEALPSVDEARRSGQEDVIAQALYFTRWREEGMGTEPYGGLPNPWRWWRGRRARKREVPRVTGILTTRLERAVEDEFAAHRGSYPNPPGVNEYRRHAETLGLLVQEVCTALDSSSGYYDVIAIYEPGPPIFGREPLALCFEDSSKSIGATWMLVQPT